MNQSQSDLFQPTDPFRLHRIHAAPAMGKGGVSFDLGPFRWRPDGGSGDHALARAMAYRIAFTWNAAEGLPIAALERGVLRDFNTAAVELAEALLSEATTSPSIQARARRVLELDQAHDVDLTASRLSDCPSCQEFDATPSERRNGVALEAPRSSR